MIIHPRMLVLIWTVIGGLGLSWCVWLGAHAARAGGEFLQGLSEGRPMSWLDGLAVIASAVVATLCLCACIYAVLKIRELLEDRSD